MPGTLNWLKRNENLAMHAFARAFVERIGSDTNDLRSSASLLGPSAESDMAADGALVAKVSGWRRRGSRSATETFVVRYRG